MALYKALKNIDNLPTRPRLAVVKGTFFTKAANQTAEPISADESKALWQFLMEMTPLPISITGLLDGRLVRVNRRWSKLTGYSQAEAVGRTAAQLGLCSHPDEHKHILQALNQNGEVRDFQSCVHRDGRQPIYYAIWARKIRFMGRDCLLTMTSYATEAHKAHQALQQNDIPIA